MVQFRILSLKLTMLRKREECERHGDNEGVGGRVFYVENQGNDGGDNEDDDDDDMIVIL